jgi:hypothetical protein
MDSVDAARRTALLDQRLGVADRALDLSVVILGLGLLTAGAPSSLAAMARISGAQLLLALVAIRWVLRPRETPMQSFTTL